jgi:hypothetical protein
MSIPFRVRLYPPTISQLSPSLSVIFSFSSYWNNILVSCVASLSIAQYGLPNNGSVWQCIKERHLCYIIFFRKYLILRRELFDSINEFALIGLYGLKDYLSQEKDCLLCPQNKDALQTHS